MNEQAKRELMMDCLPMMGTFNYCSY